MEETTSVDLVRLVIFGMMVMVVFVILIVIFVLVYQRKLVNEKLKVQELKLSEERNLLYHSFRVQEEERKLFAANLHDELGAQLSLTKMTVSSLEVNEKNQVKIENSINLLNDMADSIRRISYHMHPPSLQRLGLNSAVREFIHKIHAESTAIFFEENGQNLLSEDENLQVFRIIQEAINNALKYANASEIRLTISHNQEGIKITCKDNGKGFSPNEKTGLGILNMTRRAQMIQCEFHLQSDENGTIITVSTLKPRV
jgi:signal transduction histidine kinase